MVNIIDQMVKTNLYVIQESSHLRTIYLSHKHNVYKFFNPSYIFFGLQYYNQNLNYDFGGLIRFRLYN